MGKCKICHIEAELTDGRCRLCRRAKEATDLGMHYGDYIAMIDPPREIRTKNRRSVPETKKCEWCGGEFIPVRKNQTYCCTECAHSASYDKNRGEILEKARKKTVIIPKICAECGREYMPSRNDPRLKFCSGQCCSAASNRAKRERERAKHEQKRLLAEASADTASMA